MSFARSLAVALILFATVMGALPVAASAHQDASPVGAALDLGAMLLTPDDLASEGFEGYGLRYGWTDTLDDELVGSMVGTYSAAEIEEVLDEAGYLRSLGATYEIPSEDDPAVSTRSIWIYVDEYAGDDGLSDVLDVYLTYENGETLESSRTIGDQSRIVTYRVEETESTPASRWMVLGFAVGNLTAEVYLGGDEPMSRDEKPTVAKIEALGLRLLDRIEAVLDTGAPGLNARIFRLASDGEVVSYASDYYSRRDGDSLPIFGYGDDVNRQRDASDDAAGVVDLYTVEQLIGSSDVAALDWLVRLRSFEDETAASEWLHGVADATAAEEGIRDFVTREAPELGDEAVAFSYVYDDGVSGSTYAWPVVAVRIDNLGLLISLGRMNELPPVTLFAELVAAQIACVENADCTTESPAPAELLALAADDL